MWAIPSLKRPRRTSFSNDIEFPTAKETAIRDAEARAKKEPYFFYGTLMDPSMVHKVLGLYLRENNPMA